MKLQDWKPVNTIVLSFRPKRREEKAFCNLRLAISMRKSLKGYKRESLIRIKQILHGLPFAGFPQNDNNLNCHSDGNIEGILWKNLFFLLRRQSCAA